MAPLGDGGAAAAAASNNLVVSFGEMLIDFVPDDEFGHMLVNILKQNNMAAMRAAKAAGVLCSYDPNVRLPLWPSPDAAREGILSIWKEADFIKVSDDEVAFLTRGDANDEKNVLSLWFDGLKLLVVTDGDKGCRYFTKDFKGSVPGFKVDTVDTTGAGDAFVGSLLVNVAKDDSIFHNEEKLREALKFSNACGAICTTKKGAIPALPTVATAQDLIAKAN
ncbi:Fructokinase-2 [Zea mays]|uniref:Fructokinase-2 n=1 Tax=Zea mays TaxID=4577 RepID=A0A1D6LDS6_MAIZE|nr:Fructokinase-2 [Zea mays]